MSHPSLPPQQWPLAREWFDRLVECSPDERLALWPQVPATVADEVRSLLAHHDAEDDAFLPAAGAARAELQGRVGQRLGPWRITGFIGHGGMGDVFAAERADGNFTSQVAIKLLGRGLDSAAVLHRFAQEQQALARMNHPHIARLFDAGLTPERVPYFVMEHVQGKPIDVAVHGLPLEQRLALFLQLTDAVSHAHRNLLVHRDLKPGNVLVTTDHQVKLLDFGIAKALDPLEHGNPAETLNPERPFTPHYASPEQVRGEPVSTGTDIYSLGVLLYVMLTGQRPYGRSATTPLEAVKCVLEELPTRPSSLSPGVVQDPQWLATRKRLRGDLDNILLKALDKTVSQRYPSVEAMAQDVRAFLSGQPVSAHPPSRLYLASKFVQRHRIGTALAGLALAAVLGFAGVAWQQKVRAEARFGDLRQLAHAVLFDYHDLIEPLVGATPVRKRLVQDALTYLDKLNRDAPQDRGVRREMGMAYRVVGYVQRNGFRRPHLGDTQGALHSYGQGVAILEALVAQDDTDSESDYELALVLSARAGLQSEDKQLPLALAQLQRAAGIFERRMAKDEPDHRHRLELARTHLRMADAMNFNGDPKGSRQQTEQAKAVLNSLAALAPNHKELPHVWVWVHNRAAALARDRGDWPTVVEEETTSRARLLALVAQQPDNGRFQEDLAGAAQWLMMAAGEMNQPALVQRWADDALGRWASLVKRDPQDRTARSKLLDTTTQACVAQRQVARLGEAQQHCDHAQAILAELATQWPDEGFLARRRTALAAAQQALAAAR
jgi:eukaryotic-like serine/threonine-protein kinase